ncbi:MAG TPA: PucR family transcriptional regulator ligand-binding domain-containing protein [Thermoleophilaceae bacterium]|nr:PucR family transcriptional regulator ligand-binding domain-containing protein [Thermoleophilaceae bacterium]
MLTLRTLLDEMELGLTTGEEGAEAPVRWVHITELPDPTPWLSGGELILTTGLQLTSEELQREFVRRLSDHQLAGLGFGVGFKHEALPAPLVEEAEQRGFPVFEVPYDLPFIAITEKAFARLVNEQYEVLQRGIAIHKRLERLVIEERGLDELVRALAAALGGTVTVLDAQCDPLVQRTFRRELDPGVLEAVCDEVRRLQEDPGEAGTVELVPEHPAVAGRSVVLPVYTRGRGAPHAWLFAARDSGGLGDFERLILQQATTVVALELMRQRAMHDTERRLAGDVLAEALTGRLAERELASRLRPFGVGEQAAVLVFAVDDPVAEAGELDRALHDEGHGALVAPREDLLVAVVDAGGELDPVELARGARSALGGAQPPRTAASRPAPVGALRRSFHEARIALDATAIANGDAPDVASYRDLGASQLLLNLQDDEALSLYCQSVLGPLEDDSGEYGEELIRSLEAFIEQNGQWEKAARQLFCHRHTLRYRIRRVEELTGRDLGTARDRIEFWLALRGRELVP